MKNQKGFTLIEMIVVMAVLAILASAVYPNISGYMMANREKYRVNQEYVVNKALVQYYALTGKYYTPGVGCLTGDTISAADTMIAEINDKTGSMISNDSAIYQYIKLEGSDDPGATDIRKIRVVAP